MDGEEQVALVVFGLVDAEDAADKGVIELERSGGIGGVDAYVALGGVDLHRLGEGGVDAECRSQPDAEHTVVGLALTQQKFPIDEDGVNRHGALEGAVYTLSHGDLLAVAVTHEDVVLQHLGDECHLGHGLDLPHGRRRGVEHLALHGGDL